VILIAHRGNLNGSEPEKENNPQYIDKAIDSGYSVEVDIRGSFMDGLFLGHDKAQYEVSPEWIFERAEHLWLHAKDIQALYTFTQQTTGCNAFWHQTDQHALTTGGFIWAYPGNILTPRSICVMPETSQAKYTEQDLQLCAGICSDYVSKYK
jgi:hypothetical protein